jgi:hypothetical protein
LSQLIPGEGPVPQTLAPQDIREVLAAAADVVFSDGVPPEFIDQWAEETCFLLRARTGGDEHPARPAH